MGSVPGVGSIRGVFELFLPGAFLLINLVGVAFLIGPSTAARLDVLKESPVSAGVMAIPFAYLLGVVLRLFKVGPADKCSGLWMRRPPRTIPYKSTINVREYYLGASASEGELGKLLRNVDEGVRERIEDGATSRAIRLNCKCWTRYRCSCKPPSANSNRALLDEFMRLSEESWLSREAFPYPKILEATVRRDMTQDAAEFFERVWCDEFNSPKKHKQSINFYKTVVACNSREAAEELYSAEALSRFVASMFVAQVIALAAIGLLLLVACHEVSPSTPSSKGNSSSGSSNEIPDVGQASSGEANQESSSTASIADSTATEEAGQSINSPIEISVAIPSSSTAENQESVTSSSTAGPVTTKQAAPSADPSNDASPLASNSSPTVDEEASAKQSPPIGLEYEHWMSGLGIAYVLGMICIVINMRLLRIKEVEIVFAASYQSRQLFEPHVGGGWNHHQ